MRSEKFIHGKKCYIYENSDADIFLIQPVAKHDLTVLDREAEIIKELTHNTPFTLVSFLIEDWNNELSPWDTPAVFGNENFGSGAAKTLLFITDTLLPELYSTYGKKHCYLGGYSLAGLFALWSAYQVNSFSGIAAVSPSVWFPCWKDYMKSNAIQTPAVYLSLGEKEEKTRNRIMSSVGDNIRSQYDLLCNTATIKRCMLEWNQGNHFVDSERRTAKGFAWLLNSQNCCNA